MQLSPPASAPSKRRSSPPLVHRCMQHCRYTLDVTSHTDIAHLLIGCGHSVPLFVVEYAAHSPSFRNELPPVPSLARTPFALPSLRLLPLHRYLSCKALPFSCASSALPPRCSSAASSTVRWADADRQRGRRGRFPESAVVPRCEGPSVSRAPSPCIDSALHCSPSSRRGCPFAQRALGALHQRGFILVALSLGRLCGSTESAIAAVHAGAGGAHRTSFLPLTAGQGFAHSSRARRRVTERRSVPARATAARTRGARSAPMPDTGAGTWKRWRWKRPPSVQQRQRC